MNTILIASRGEIAVRIMRTCRRLGFSPVAVFSDADADAPHVRLADQAVRIGPPEAARSYLNIDAILDAAEQTGADAVHPGYGFLSEQSAFARRILDAGLTWIGPPPSAMEIMGNKTAARNSLADTSVPVVPGTSLSGLSDAACEEAAARLGYPVMIKAAAGGGGRGMRLVADAHQLLQALHAARSESARAFGSDELLLEKALVRPRHVEIQIFADRHGQVVYLGERDCSVQRRHQKVIEESPAPGVSDTLRQAMGQAAVAAARAVGYEGAGTVEFLLTDDGEFWFIEMNTRLQVEHPVTEMVTGFDLVEWQLRIADGAPLPVSQEQITLQGHAVEARLYAESPEQDFRPDTGRVLFWSSGADGAIRIDHALETGQEITPHYDAMLAKFIAHGDTRNDALRQIRRALNHTVVLGLRTNRTFLLDTLQHPVFQQGQATTEFIREHWNPTDSPPPLLTALAAAVFVCAPCQNISRELQGWSTRPSVLSFDPENRNRTITVQQTGQTLQISGPELQETVIVLSCSDHRLDFERSGVRSQAWFAFDRDGTAWIQYEKYSACFRNHLADPAGRRTDCRDGRVMAPMPGSVLSVHVSTGTPVDPGQPLLVLEAMKMEQTIEAPVAGTIADVCVEPGSQVTPGQLLIDITPGAS